MPWKVAPVFEQRSAFLAAVTGGGESISQACRAHGISRKTGHKWLKRLRADPTAPLWDRSRKPLHSPTRTGEVCERAVLEIRDRFGWGPQKIRAALTAQPDSPILPSERTIAAILARHGKILPPVGPAALPQRFERSYPNQLWQFDFKGPLEVGRKTVNPFVVVDDHSRYLLALEPSYDKKNGTAWALLWALFERYGLPDQVISDNAFSGHRIEGLTTVSWIDMCLIRTGVDPIHGRPYHPQTQGKVERFNGTLERELFPKTRKDSIEHFYADCELWRTTVYNTLRPHESLGDRPPLSRWFASSRKRPATLPQVTYPEGAVVRKISPAGDLRWNRYRILAGFGLSGQFVRVAESDHDLELFFGPKLIRKVPLKSLQYGTLL
jgi:transposase InsO family protein